jgi:large subunit ribosomal protein L7/L12
MDLEALVEHLSTLTVMEAADLSRRLEKKWGVSAAITVQPADAAVPEPEMVEEQTEFMIILTAVEPAKKIVVIKEVRAITGLGLKESKELVDSTPQTIREVANKADALMIKAKIEAAGGTIELK